MITTLASYCVTDFPLKEAPTPNLGQLSPWSFAPAQAPLQDILLHKQAPSQVDTIHIFCTRWLMHRGPVLSSTGLGGGDNVIS